MACGSANTKQAARCNTVGDDRSTPVGNQTRIYLDNAATTPLCAEARAAMEPYLNENFGNASSPYALGRASRAAVDKARMQVAALIGARMDEVVFTAGGTESDNWALMGVALNHFQERGHILVSAIEHHAVLEPAHALCDLGFDVEIVPVDGNGIVAPEEIERRLRPNTRIVSLMMVNNEIGVLQPIADIGALVHERGVLLHTDAVQAAGKVPLDVKELNVDLLSMSAHKFGGPKGIGALFVRRGTKMRSWMRGGAQERGRRAGTENVAAIAALGAAAEAVGNNLQRNRDHWSTLQQHLEHHLLQLPGAAVNAAGAPRVPHITNFSLAGQRAETLAFNLDLAGFAVGTGSACASGAIEPSHVLTALGLDHDTALSSLRVSLGVQNTKEEVDEFLKTLQSVLQTK